MKNQNIHTRINTKAHMVKIGVGVTPELLKLQAIKYALKSK